MTSRGRAYSALFLANAGAVVLIWWVGLEAHAFDTLAGGLNAAGRVTALVGTYLVLVQLVLRTHVPWVVRAFGEDLLKSAHTWNGYAAFVLIGLHVVLQVVGYALLDRVDVIGELGLQIANYEGILLAVGGLLLLGALTLIAIDPIRHRMPWPTWRALHLYTYVAIALSVPHQIATGSDFVDAPIAVVYWSALEIAVLVILLAARLPPIWRAMTAAGRPHPAIAAVGGIVIAMYLVGTVRVAPERPTVTLATPRPEGTARPASSAVAAPVPPSPSLPAGTLVAVEGDMVETQYGTAQVRVILSGGRITDVEPMLLPAATRRSKTISTSAEYWLRKRAIAAQSAEFDVLSGATYTSRGYQASLESALRAAGMTIP